MTELERFNFLEELRAKHDAELAAKLKERKEKRSAWAKQNREANPERHKANAAAYYQKHRFSCDARNKAWREANPERWAELQHKYYLKRVGKGD